MFRIISNHFDIRNMDLIRFGPLPGPDDQVLIDELFLSQQPHLAKSSKVQVIAGSQVRSSVQHGAQYSDVA